MRRLPFLSTLVALAACGGAPAVGPHSYDVIVEGNTSHFVGGGAVPGPDAGVSLTVAAAVDAGGVQTVLPSDAGRVLQGSLDAGGVDSGAVVVPIPGLAAAVAGLDESRVVVTHEALATAAIERVPFQTWPAVPGHVVGLLYASGPQPWGSAFEHGRGLATSPDRTEYKFGFDRSSPFAEYFVSQGQGYNLLHNWNPSGPPHEAAMFLPGTPNPWGLSHIAHVVDLEVNDGQGAAANNIHFVVTNARVLDGTAAAPLDPAAVLVSLRRRADTTVAAIQVQQAPRMAREEAAARARGAGPATGPNEVIGLWPTWVAADHALEVVFVVTMTGSAAFPTQNVMQQCPRCPCARGPGGRVVCAPCVACNPRAMQITPRASWGWELVITDRVDASGHLVSERISGPRELPSATQPGVPQPTDL